MDENKHKSLGWFIVLLEKWPANKDSHSGKYRLRKFFERYNFLKMASNIYATQIFEEKFEEWRSPPAHGGIGMESKAHITHFSKNTGDFSISCILRVL